MPTISDVRPIIVIYDAATLSYVAWDGALRVGSIVIGAVTQSGTWTVQPGNTANTTAWKVDGSAVTQPVSLATAPSTPVTGTFWQATQPVSLATAAPTTTLTASSPTAASVGVASAQAVASNGSRKGLVLVNTSTNNISFGLGAAAVLNSGITVTPNGSWTMDTLTFTTVAINAIAGGAASNLSIQEFT